MQVPPIPSWDALHPLIIHFPIVLLLVAPVFILIGVFVQPEKRRLFLISALILMLLGTVATYLSVATGEAAGKLAERAPGVEAVLERHEELAETTRLVFSVLAVIFIAILAIPRLWPKVSSQLASRLLPLIFLVFYSAGALILVNTAHNGGRLVHEFGVHAIVAGQSASPTGLPGPSSAPAELRADRD